jgi:hypothetical protein
MNSRYTFLVTSLLSVAPFFCYSNDLSCCKDLSDLGYISVSSRLGKVEHCGENVQSALAYLLADQIPDKYNCSFDYKGRIKKVALKKLINDNLLKNSLDITIDLPDSAQLPILNTDQILEIAYVAAHDALARKSFSVIGIDAGKTLLREKLVEVVLWLVAQTHVEDLLPESITDSYVYEQTVIELARFYTDKVIKIIIK